MWYFFAFLGAISFGTTNIIDKMISRELNPKISLLIRYSVALCILILSLIIFWIDLQKSSLILISLGFINYGINRIMYSWLQKTPHTWVFFIIAYLYLIFLFLINIYLFGKDEFLAYEKFILWWLFILLVGTILYRSWGKKSEWSLTGYLYALMCATWWTITFAIATYSIKTLGIHPINALIAQTIWSIIIALWESIIHRKEIEYKELSLKNFLIPWFSGLFLSIGLIWMYSAYLYLPANIVNTISLADLVVTLWLSYILLHEKIEKTNLILSIVAIICIAGFSFL